MNQNQLGGCLPKDCPKVDFQESEPSRDLLEVEGGERGRETGGGQRRRGAAQARTASTRPRTPQPPTPENISSMSISVSNAVQTPEVPEETWTAYTAVVKGKGSKLAAVFQLSPDESKIEVKAIVDNADGNWVGFRSPFLSFLRFSPYPSPSLPPPTPPPSPPVSRLSPSCAD